MNTINSSQRLTHLDAAKGLCIMLMVIGHTRDVGAEVFHYIYSFHMPAFFMLAGATHRYKQGPLTPLIWQKVKRLILPAWALGAICSVPFIFRLANSRITTDDFSHRLLGTLTGQNSAQTTFDSTPLWFLYALFLVYVANFILEKSSSRKGATRLSVILITASLIFFSLSQYAPAQIAYAISGLLFFSLGSLLRPAITHIPAERMYLWGQVATFAAIWLISTENSVTTKMNTGMVESSSSFLYSILAAIFGTLLVIRLSLLVPNWLRIQNLATLSLPIVGLNYFIEARVHNYLSNPWLSAVNILILVATSIAISRMGRLGALLHGKL